MRRRVELFGRGMGERFITSDASTTWSGVAGATLHGNMALCVYLPVVSWAYQCLGRSGGVWGSAQGAVARHHRAGSVFMSGAATR